jgi:hypothetical protein
VTRALLAALVLIAPSALRADVAVPTSRGNTAEPSVGGATPFGYLVPKERAAEFYRKWGAQPLGAVSFFTPTQQDVVRFEQGVDAYLEVEWPRLELDRYYRQYVGVIWQGKRWLWVLAFEPDRSRKGRSDPFQGVFGTDACISMWRLSFDLARAEFVGFKPAGGCA